MLAMRVKNIKFLSDREIGGYRYCQEKKETTPYDKKNFTCAAAKDEYRCSENERKGMQVMFGAETVHERQDRQKEEVAERDIPR